MVATKRMFAGARNLGGPPTDRIWRGFDSPRPAHFVLLQYISRKISESMHYFSQAAALSAGARADANEHEAAPSRGRAARVNGTSRAGQRSAGMQICQGVSRETERRQLKGACGMPAVRAPFSCLLAEPREGSHQHGASGVPPRLRIGARAIQGRLAPARGRECDLSSSPPGSPATPPRASPASRCGARRTRSARRRSRWPPPAWRRRCRPRRRP